MSGQKLASGRKRASGQYRNRGGVAAPPIAVGLMGLAVGIGVLLCVDLVASVLTVQGWLSIPALDAVALGAIFLAALGDGIFLARRQKTRPLLWGLIAGAEIALVTCLPGLVCTAIATLHAALFRLLAALLGGVTAGVLTAARKK
jgi:putative membrane protein (TIGR04086 family)